MFHKTLILTVLAFVLSLVVFLIIWQYQRRTLTWTPVPFEIVSSEIAHRRVERELGKIWTATINYSFNGSSYSKTIDNLPFGATQVFVNPNQPEIVVGERGPTIRALFVPILAMSASGIFLLVLGLIKFSPKDD